MEGSAVFIIGAFIALIVFLALVAGRKNKSESSGSGSSSSTTSGTLRGSLPVNPPVTGASTTTKTGAPVVHRTDNTAQNRVFSYTARDEFWLCPNCACENSPSSTHCCVCFWDKSVGVR